jgi:methyl-accepting chemotaxis protein
MSSTAEELSGQAEQLQEAIAFFKLGNDLPRTVERRQPQRKPVNSYRQAAAAGRKEAVKPSGIMLDLDDGKDALDDDFERY